MPRTLETLGDHIRKRRLELGLLQREVAAQLGVDESTVHNWECGHSRPTRQFEHRIIAYLGYRPDVAARKL